MQTLEQPWQPGSFQQSPIEKDQKHAPRLWRKSTRKQGEILLKQNTAPQNKRCNDNGLGLESVLYLIMIRQCLHFPVSYKDS